MSHTHTGLTAAIERFRALLGNDAMLVDQPEKTDYNDPFPLGDPEEFAPGVVLFPTSREQVQDIVRIANELDVPVWANSRGKNNGYGGNSPRLKGTVVVNLERMNRVLEVNEELGYAVVEPGVRFRDLYAHLQENGHKLWISVPELDWGSVIGNALERGFGYTAYGENGTKLCGQEIVLPDGELLRTGMGAQDGNKAFHLYKSGFGPSVDGLFQQSNLGIVVKSGVWLMPQPEAFAAVDISVPEWNDLAPLADTIRELQLRGTIVGTALIGETITVAFTIDKRSRWYDGPGAAPDTLAQQVIEEFGVGRWNAWFGVYGTPERVEADIADVERAFGRIPGSGVRVTRYAGDVAANDVNFEHWTRAGIPSMHGAKMLEWRERTRNRCAHLLLPRTTADGCRAARRCQPRPRALRGLRARLPRGLPRPRALRESHLRAHLRRLRSGARRRRARAVRQAPRIRHREGLRRVPLARRVHGRGVGRLRLQRPCHAPLPRRTEGCARPEGHPRSRQGRCLGDART